MSTLSILRCLQKCDEGTARVEKISECSGLTEKDFIEAKRLAIEKDFIKECNGYLQITEKGKDVLDKLHETLMNFKRALEESRKRLKG